MAKQPSYVASVANHIGEITSLSPETTVILGLSGGPDSVFLLHALHTLRSTQPFTLVAVHLNHTLRGTCSDGDEEFARNLCNELHVACITEQSDISTHAAEHGKSLEMAGRTARYELFTRIATQRAPAVIMTGHTADDRIETAVMRLVSGAGLSGITGLREISSIRTIPLIRPLLSCWKEDILQYLDNHGLMYSSDASNLSDAYLRNRIRNHIIPSIEQECNVSFRKTFSRSLDVLEGQADFIAVQSKKVRQSAQLYTGKLHIYDKNRLLNADPALAGELILQSLYELADDGFRPSSAHIHALMAMMKHSHTTCCEFPQQMRVHTDRSHLYCGHTSELNTFFDPPNYDTCVPIPGSETLCCGLTISVDVDLLHRADIHSHFDANAAWRTILSGGAFSFSADIPVPHDCTQLKIRNRRPGDRLTSKAGTKKLKDLFIDEHIPALLRNVIPLIIRTEQPLWFPGTKKKTPKSAHYKTIRIICTLSL